MQIRHDYKLQIDEKWKNLGKELTLHHPLFKETSAYTSLDKTVDFNYQVSAFLRNGFKEKRCYPTDAGYETDRQKSIITHINPEYEKSKELMSSDHTVDDDADLNRPRPRRTKIAKVRKPKQPVTQDLKNQRLTRNYLKVVNEYFLKDKMVDDTQVTGRSGQSQAENYKDA